MYHFLVSAGKKPPASHIYVVNSHCGGWVSKTNKVSSQINQRRKTL
jgi:hypothetical protein